MTLNPIPGSSIDEEKKLVDFISNIPLFACLTKTELSYVAEKMMFKKLEPGEILFREWDKAEFVFFVESGELEITKKTGPDQNEVAAILRRGRSMGEMAIIDNFPWSYSVGAKTKAAFALLSRPAFEEILKINVEIGIKILKGLAHLLSQNLKKTSSRLADNMMPMG